MAETLTFGCRLNIAESESMRALAARADLLQLAASARALHPGLALGADFIAGSPTETEEHLCAMIELVAEARLTFLRVFSCSARAGTPAARRPQPPMPLRACFLASRLGRVEQAQMEPDGVAHTAHFVRVGNAARGPLLAARVTRHDGTSLWAEAA